MIPAGEQSPLVVPVLDPPQPAAADQAEEALVHCGDMPVLFYLHGACLLAAGRRREGARSLEQAMDLDAASHTVLFELFPDLVKDPLVLDLIDQYSR